ncbi:glycoside hydrolase family 16 protein [Mucilaginibacter sp. BT774]|uniref:glycoside hydrolase family 16 protein n=1 Tax=Mucilaginibacter sp. BT774 TaxID=3062276 RepID=UPI0026764587|nr:glycoside hydrolase family 16 protein [Mucilaginibacter sp. BT774]MDO3627104.1 glycoside hydrolase family 16 protein [Mucilaginibacter sp. BT774]
MLLPCKRKSAFKLSGIKLIAIVLPFTFLSCSKKNGLTTTIPPPIPVDTTKTVKPVYALVWSDEFDGTTVDTSKWAFETGGGGWGNNEKEYYQAANATVANGNLMITAKKESVGGEPYTSARMTTQGKEAPTYGRIEARIKTPLGMGFWPAFWMLGSNIQTVSWPSCGEMDIMEHVNNTNTFYGTMHWNVNGHVSYGSTINISSPGDYHLYAIEWDQNSIRWYIDDTLYQTGNIKSNINSTGAFHLPFFILLNFALGGNFPNAAVDESLLPATMYVDYVRVYKQTN